MILLFDVGNTEIKIGTSDGKTIQKTYRLKTQTDKTADEYYLILLRLITCEEVKRIIIASVVPAVTEVLIELSKEHFDVDPLVVGPGIKTGLFVKTDHPKEVGADLIAAAVGSFDYGDSALIIDLGTATKYIYVKQKSILGVIISPGVKVSIDALVRNTALLPDIDIAVPKTVLGTNTITCMQSGVTYGVAAQVDGLITRIRHEVKNATLNVIVTGGLAELIGPLCATPLVHDKHLVLKGLLTIAQRNL